MIGKLSGRIEYRTEDHILLDVRGVGYLIYCSERTLMALPGVGQVVALYTDMVVRDDLMQLFGFLSLVEKEWHRLLLTVQGVGAKASLAILGALGPNGVSRAIAMGDWNTVKAARGIGPKTAQRVVNELKDKAPKVMAMLNNDSSSAPAISELDDVIEPIASSVTEVAPNPVSNASAQADAMSALSNLGYGPGDAAAAVVKAMTEDNMLDAAGLIRAALKLLAPKG
jgi:Holliday junction DNA helicase RuvA